MIKNSVVAYALLIGLFVQNFCYGILFFILLPRTEYFGGSSLHDTMEGFNNALPEIWGLLLLIVIASSTLLFIFNGNLKWCKLSAAFALALWVFAFVLYLEGGRSGVAFSVALPEVIVWASIMLAVTPFRSVDEKKDKQKLNS